MRLRASLPQRGATLVELIVSIVIISIGLAGVMLVMDRTTRSSADPMIQYQAIAIAEAYLEEALLKEFTDPDGLGGETRATYDDVNDYNFTDIGARDQNGQAIAELGQYTVAIAVTSEVFNTIGAANVRRVQVTVTSPFGGTVVMSGYRTNY